MNRQQRRKELREGKKTTDKLKNWLNGLTPEQKRLFALTVEQRVQEIDDQTEMILDSCYIAAISDNVDLDFTDIKKIAIEANVYMQECREYLEESKGDYFMKVENEELMESVREKIREKIKNKMLKSKALLELKKEFELPANILSNLWLEVKSENQKAYNKHTPTKYKNIKTNIPASEEEKEKFLQEIGMDIEGKLKEDKKEVKTENKEDKPKLKIKLMEIEGEHGLYYKGTEGVKIGNSVYKDITDVEEEKNAYTRRMEDKEEEIKSTIEKLNEELINRINTKKRELEKYSEIEEVFNI